MAPFQCSCCIYFTSAFVHHDGNLTFCEHAEYASVFKGIKKFLSPLTSSLHPIKLLHKGTERIKKTDEVCDPCGCSAWSRGFGATSLKPSTTLRQIIKRRKGDILYRQKVAG